MRKGDDLIDTLYDQAQPDMLLIYPSGDPEYNPALEYVKEHFVGPDKKFDDCAYLPPCSLRPFGARLEEYSHSLRTLRRE